MLDRLQLGLEQLYRIETDLQVTDFLLGEAARDALGVSRAPREQLLVSQSEDGLDLGLFVDEGALEQLEQSAGAHLHDDNLSAFLLAVEGVSHFVCVAWNARRQRAISALELELQAEVDKFVTCLLGGVGDQRAASDLRERLFVRCEFDPELSGEESERYELANRCAYRYSGALEQRFVRSGRTCDMLSELRRFYRLPLAGKLALIAAG